jgi:adenosine deaminase
MIKVTKELLTRLPKTELHVHLDGSLRPETMIALAREYGAELPVWEPEMLRDYMHVQDARNLLDYLARFDTTLSVMQTAESLERIAYELAEDAAAENVRYMEVRYSPMLHTRDRLSLADAVDAPLRGLRAAERDHKIRAQLIICGLRHMDPATVVEMAELTVAYKDRGVVAFDLAGGEAGNLPRKFQPAFDIVADRNMAITIHAGEAAGPESVHEALHRCHANRIGHGTRLFEDPDLMRYVNDFRIPLEINLTSNVQTRAVPSFEAHPLRRYYDEGLVLSLNTDNRLMSATTVTEEYWRAHQALEFDWDELCDLALMGFESAFISFQEKVALIEEVAAEIEGINAELEG